MQATTRVRTLADLIGTSSRMRDIVLIVGASLVTGLAAQVEIRLPFTPVPITLQTFVVFLLAAALIFTLPDRSGHGTHFTRWILSSVADKLAACSSN